MPRYIDADKLWNDRPQIPEGKSQDYGAGFSECMWGFSRNIRKQIDTESADVVPKSEEGAECPTCYGTGRIGTTNWLTKNMTKKQIAEEKANAIAEHEQHIKAEVAREIFEEIYEDCFDQYGYIDYEALAELKKKYTGE